MKAIFVLSIVIGVVLVIQPPFLFGDSNQDEGYPFYYVGVILALIYSAMSSALNAMCDNLISKEALNVLQLNFYSGIGILATSILYLPFDEVRNPILN